MPYDPITVLTEMMAERGQAWDISPVRSDLIRKNIDQVPNHLHRVADEMLEQSDAGAAFWATTTERYRVLRAIAASLGRPAQSDASRVLEQVIRGAAEDQVLNRSWVKSAIDLIRRMAD